MKVAIVVLATCLMVTTIVAAVLWRDNALLAQQLINNQLVTPRQLSSVAESCENLVQVNHQCMAFSHRVREMLDVKEGSREEIWAGLWRGSDEVRRSAGGPDKGSPGR